MFPPVSYIKETSHHIRNVPTLFSRKKKKADPNALFVGQLRKKLSINIRTTNS